MVSVYTNKALEWMLHRGKRGKKCIINSIFLSLPLRLFTF